MTNTEKMAEFFRPLRDKMAGRDYRPKLVALMTGLAFTDEHAAADTMSEEDLYNAGIVIADTARAASAAFAVPTIDKPARIGHTIFSAGVRVSTVIERAQREFEYRPNPPHDDPVPVEWREAVQEFVDRCERGEIRSVRTYAKFKELLAR